MADIITNWPRYGDDTGHALVSLHTSFYELMLSNCCQLETTLPLSLLVFIYFESFLHELNSSMLV